ncbi:MAG: hypothetical protein WCT29_03325 [Candidatus Paceibacterota bacterium]|jgi:hypothetical protein
MRDDAKKIKIIIVGAFFLFIVVYGFARSTDLIFGVKIKNVKIAGEPAETLVVRNESVTKISGNARNAINLSLNGREISIDLKGNFEETIALLPGYNIINIQATDKFGYVDEKNYQLILTQALGN